MLYIKHILEADALANNLYPDFLNSFSFFFTQRFFKDINLISTILRKEVIISI